MFAEWRITALTAGSVVVFAGLLGGGGAPQSQATVKTLKAVAPGFFPDVFRLASDPALRGGTVVVRVMVEPRGSVVWATVVQADNFYRPWYETFETLARQWRFLPRHTSQSDRGYEVDIVFSFVVLPFDAADSDVSTILRPPSTVELRVPGPEFLPSSLRPEQGLVGSESKKKSDSADSVGEPATAEPEQIAEAPRIAIAPHETDQVLQWVAPSPGIVRFLRIRRPGAVSVVVHVSGDTGRALDAKVVDRRGLVLLRDHYFAALAKQWRFAPSENGADYDFTLHFNFVPKREGTPRSEIGTVFVVPGNVEIQLPAM